MTNLDDLEAKARAATRCGQLQIGAPLEAHFLAVDELHATLNPTVALALIRVAKATKRWYRARHHGSQEDEESADHNLDEAHEALDRAMEGIK